MKAGTMTAGTMAGTVISRHDKRSRETPNAGLYLYLPVCTIIAPKVQRKPTLYYCTATGREARVSLPQTDPS